jgi:3-isopropylmalate/(R)-2-methylmalate dehydratase small subunit
MAKTKFNIITSTCVPLPLENVDTDQIIPARFLKATTREEKFFGDNLFRDWRYNADGSLNKDFVLNNPTYGGQVLVAGKNFGSGSSMQPGRLPDTASVWWYPVSLPIFIRITS